MPGGDEQADLDGRATAYLAEEEGGRPEFFTGLPVHLASSKGQSSPSPSSQPSTPSLWFYLFENCTRRNYPSAALYPNQVKWKLSEETSPSVSPQLSSG